MSAMATDSSLPTRPASRGVSGRSKAPAETTPLMLDVPGHFRDLPMFLDTEQRLKSGRWKAMVEAVVSKARASSTGLAWGANSRNCLPRVTRRSHSSERRCTLKIVRVGNETSRRATQHPPLGRCSGTDSSGRGERTSQTTLVTGILLLCAPRLIDRHAPALHLACRLGAPRCCPPGVPVERCPVTDCRCRRGWDQCQRRRSSRAEARNRPSPSPSPGSFTFSSAGWAGRVAFSWGASLHTAPIGGSCCRCPSRPPAPTNAALPPDNPPAGSGCTASCGTSSPR